MSDTGIISQDYQNTANLFQTINQSVILLKKRFYGLSGASQISDEEMHEASESLAKILHELVASLESEQNEICEGEDSVSVPPALVRRIREQRQGTLQWYMEDLRDLSRALAYREPITKQHIQYLDQLCDELDAESTALHRKLWRK